MFTACSPCPPPPPPTTTTPTHPHNPKYHPTPTPTRPLPTPPLKEFFYNSFKLIFLNALWGVDHFQFVGIVFHLSLLILSYRVENTFNQFIRILQIYYCYEIWYSLNFCQLCINESEKKQYILAKNKKLYKTSKYLNAHLDNYGDVIVLRKLEFTNEEQQSHFQCLKFNYHYFLLNLAYTTAHINA